MAIPRRLRFATGAFAGDGGLIGFQAFDEADREVIFFLDWSGRARAEYRTQLSINGKPIEKGSAEEGAWIELVRKSVPSRSQVSPDPLNTEERRRMALILLQHLDSFNYREGPPPPPPTLEEVLRDLLRQGRRLGAMKTYRMATPGASLREAKEVVERLELEIAG